MARHNELRDGVADLSGKAFTPENMRDDPKIFTGRAMQGGGRKKAKQKGKERRHHRRRRGRRSGTF